MKFTSLAYSICFLILLSLPAFAANPPTEETPEIKFAFYYGNYPPINQLKFFRNIVIDPGNGVDPHKLSTNNRNVFAYASLGEVIGLNQYRHPIDKSWVLAKNENWQSLVMDQSNPAWQQFFLNEVITPLWDKGYRGFFLDTLDAFRIASEDPKRMLIQQQGMISIIRAIKKKYPEAKLIANRGFEIMPQIKSLISEVVTESLFAGWDNKNKRYFWVPEKQRAAVLIELNKIKAMGIPITIVDYLAPEHADEARDVAKKIAALGFNPWVTNGALTELYLFNVKLIPRKILLFYQGKLNDVDEKIGSYVSRTITMPLNYMGYITELRNINAPLPHDINPRDYAGIVVAIDGFLLGREKELYDWYLSILAKKIPLVVLNNFGFPLENVNLKPFQLSYPAFNYETHTIKVKYSSPMMGYEIAPITRRNSFIPVSILAGTSLYTLVNAIGTQADTAAIMPWGGYYLTDNFLVPIINNNYRWSINPFEFFKQALHVSDMPIPDTTTENGRRLMFVQVDGDGFANRGAWFQAPYVGEILLSEILEQYTIPSTISVVQGEIAANGLHPELSGKLENIARRIFALPHVELASHTFSHPFIWRKAAQYKGNKPNPYTLRIPNYHFNLYTEINGSIDYINQHLAPAGKKCKMFLWSGEGDIPEEALKLVYQAGIGNINPGAIITKYNQSVTQVSSLGLNDGPYFQVFAPIGNDDETIGHSKYFYSLIGIIRALQLTEEPLRLKPIDIYYHFYSLSQKGGIKALHAVYDWALSQPVMNIYASDYYNKITDFNQLAMAEKDGGWIFETNDALRELRIPTSMGYPDLEQSRNIIGYSTHHDEYYVHIGPGGEAFLRTTSKPSSLPYLVEANARITRFIRDKHRIDFSIEGYLPPKFTLANMDTCNVWNGQKKLMPKTEQGSQKVYEFTTGTGYELSIQCK